MSVCTASPRGCACEEGNDPRHAGSCFRCGKPIGGAFRGVRDLKYERDFLLEAERIAERRFGLPIGGFQTAVERRLEMGEELYPGRHASLDAQERAEHVSEEAQDAGAYAVLDAQIRLNADLDDSAAWHLHEIAVHAAAIDHHARQLKRG